MLGHKDTEGRVESELNLHFSEIRNYGVELQTYNGNLTQDEERGALFAIIEKSFRANIFIFFFIRLRMDAVSH